MAVWESPPLKTCLIAHGLFTWRDGRPSLEACLRSAAPHVDGLIIADGLIRGVEANGAPWFSDLAWLVEADYLPAHVPISTRVWETLSRACNWILYAAKRLEFDWLLFLDGDQELHNGDRLRDWLRVWPHGQAPCFPIPRADETLHPCPWQCVHVPSIRRYVAGCFIVELVDGRTVSLVPAGTPEPFRQTRAPWISHHPERRPPGRAAHRLGRLETLLEEIPHVPTLTIPDLSATLTRG